MLKREIPIVTPCGADWSTMAPAEAKRRLCVECNKHVHDVSAMSEAEARDAIAGGTACVRYLYDRDGNVLFGAPPEGARIVPASALLAKNARTKWLAAAAMIAAPLVFEACGGAGGYARPDAMERQDGGGTDDQERVPADPIVDDASADAGGDG
jgi:hypothetical protein